MRTGHTSNTTQEHRKCIHIHRVGIRIWYLISGLIVK